MNLLRHPCIAHTNGHSGSIARTAACVPRAARSTAAGARRVPSIAAGAGPERAATAAVRTRVVLAAGIDLDALGLDIPDLGDEVRGHQEALGATFNVSHGAAVNSCRRSQHTVAMRHAAKQWLIAADEQSACMRAGTRTLQRECRMHKW